MQGNQQFFRILCGVTTLTLAVGMLVTPAFTQNPLPPTAQSVVSQPSQPCSGLPVKAVIDWAQFLFASCHTSVNPYEFVLSPATAVNLRLHWQYTTGGQVNSSPAVANGVVYVGSNDGKLYVFGLQ